VNLTTSLNQTLDLRVWLVWAIPLILVSIPYSFLVSKKGCYKAADGTGSIWILAHICKRLFERHFLLLILGASLCEGRLIDTLVWRTVRNCGAKFRDLAQCMAMMTWSPLAESAMTGGSTADAMIVTRSGRATVSAQYGTSIRARDRLLCPFML
jgi:hypothetical protein